MFEELKKEMTKEFKMTDIGLISYYLRIEVRQEDSGIFITQEGYAKEVLKKFKMDDSNPVCTPMECGLLEHMGRKEQGRTWCMDAAQLDTQRKKEEAILKTSSTTYSTTRSSSSTRPAKFNSIELGSQSQTRKMLLPH
ncbi:unnamed protein product [Microthlaspi erraticum]|uniref:Reverse transcriptase Ty1/copia-type domain-containing protein n=1 Tax=Microthlaspi erraticum TaxID=1685480 RepID=A0A6D2K1B7_9BRAS|nr:unnamed protein product [Microthlaspi erraticum]